MGSTKSTWFLRITDGQELLLPEGVFVLGEDEAACDLVLPGAGLAPRHLQLNATGVQITVQRLTDAGSVAIRGKPLTTSRTMAGIPGRSMPLQVGSTELVLRYSPDDAESAAVYTKQEGAGRDTSTKLPSDDSFRFEHLGHQYGPVRSRGLEDAARSGALRPDDMVWASDDPGFKVRAASVEGLTFPALGACLASTAAAYRLDTVGKGRLACPYCWYRFEPHEILFIASHPDFGGDDVLGPGEQQRFLPSRLTPSGAAIDGGGFVSTDMACPRCHMRLPAPILEHAPLFLSIVGAPGSGKSYFLATMTWTLRRLLPEQFSIRFTDLDASANLWLNDYEERLFLQADDQAYQSIRKTELQGDLYRQITLNHTTLSLPLPCMFLIEPNAATAQAPGKRSLILYDNAGEHFQPGEDKVGNPGTQHLAAAEGLLFLFDPTRDARFHRLLPKDHPQIKNKRIVQRQETVLVEMISRIRRRLGLDSGHRLEKPLIIVVSKMDLITHLLPSMPQPLVYRADHHCTYLNIDALATVSFLVRHMLLGVVPEIVNSAESLCANVVYVTVSALGHSPTDLTGDGQSFVVRPCDVKPYGVELPMMYLLARLGMVGLVAETSETAEAQFLGASDYAVFCGLDGGTTRVDVPLSLAGRRLQLPGSDRYFRVPKPVNDCTRIIDT